MTGQLAAVVFVVGLVVSIMIHEWGHYATARRFGMRVDQFFLGFGPTVWSRRSGETEYGVKLLPLGGFVRIKGQNPGDERLDDVPSALAARIDQGQQPAAAFRDLLVERGAPKGLTKRLVGRYERTLSAAEEPHNDADGTLVVDVDADPAQLALRLVASEVTPTGRVGDLHHRLLKGDEGRFYNDRPAWQRAIVIASGGVLHFLQAILLIFLGWLLIGPTVAIPVVSGFAEVETADGQVLGSAAEEAGLQVSDRITEVDGQMFEEFADIRTYIRDHPGEPIEVTIERSGTEDPIQVTVTPNTVTDDGEQVGQLGFFPGEETRPMDADQALYATFVGDGSFTQTFTGTFASLGAVFGPEGIRELFDTLTGQQERGLEGGISLVGATQIANEGTQDFGPLLFFALLAAINVFLGIFNLLPLPPLDGGHLAVIAVEVAVNARRRFSGEPADYTVDPRAVASIALPVIVFLVTIGIGFLWLDITNPISL